MPIKILALIPMPVNSDQCRSIPINWSELISIERNFGSMPWFWSALTGTDRHWTLLIQGVLLYILHFMTVMSGYIVCAYLFCLRKSFTNKATAMKWHGIHYSFTWYNSPWHLPSISSITCLTLLPFYPQHFLQSILSIANIQMHFYSPQFPVKKCI